MRWPLVRRILLALVAWLVVALPAWAWLFTHSSAPVVIAGHDAVAQPTFDRHAVLVMGPFVPDIRLATGQPIGVRVDVGKTTASSMEELVARYAVLAGHPQPEIRKIEETILGLAAGAFWRAAVIGLVGPGVWLLLGRQRREELSRPSVTRSVLAVGVVGAVVLATVQPWHQDPVKVQPELWIPLPQALPEVDVPPDLDRVQIEGGLLTDGTRRLIQSAFNGYATSKTFYKDVVAGMRGVSGAIRKPAKGETLGVLVSDRHDNVGMDQVVAAAADEAGATAVIDAGDDTSTGEPWETFSLDSLDDTFKDFSARVAVAGNHDNGTFVSHYLEKAGWTHLNGHAITPFGGVRMLGVDDPRSSGLGNWRDEKGIGFDGVRTKLVDELCRLDANGERVSTVVVHDATLALPALDRGCTDLILAGHLHVQVGPRPITGSNGDVGYRYTNGTTGGAAYAFALGKPRREAEFTFVTWKAGRPVGVQPVRLNSLGAIHVDPYVPLTYEAPSVG